MKKASVLSCMAVSITLLSLFSATFAATLSGQPHEITREGINVPAKFESQFKTQGLYYGLPFHNLYQMFDGTPPFAGLNVERLSTKKGVLGIPTNRYLIDQHNHSLVSKYLIIGGWKAELWGHRLLIEIYKRQLNHQMLIVDDYAGHIRRVLEVSRTTLTLINFTGFYVVFTSGPWMPDSRVPIQAFNVITGNNVPSRQAAFITGSFPDMGAHPGYILGLSQRYSNKPI